MGLENRTGTVANLYSVKSALQNILRNSKLIEKNIFKLKCITKQETTAQRSIASRDISYFNQQRKEKKRRASTAARDAER